MGRASESFGEARLKTPRKVIGAETVYHGNEFKFLKPPTTPKVRIVAVFKPMTDAIRSVIGRSSMFNVEDDEEIKIDLDAELKRHGGIDSGDRVEVQPWIEKQGRWSFVTSDPLAKDLAIFSGRKVEDVTAEAMALGGVKTPALNDENYPKIPGMEGPFRYRDGRVLYYDARKGRYYDRRLDMYLDKDDIPESFTESDGPEWWTATFGFGRIFFEASSASHAQSIATKWGKRNQMGQPDVVKKAAKPPQVNQPGSFTHDKKLDVYVEQ